MDENNEFTVEFPVASEESFNFDARNAIQARPEIRVTKLLPTPAFTSELETADLCLGWFWGPDFAFSKIKGIQSVTVGYAGGETSYPTYQSISDYTEAVRVEYDPRVITYKEILAHYIDQLGDPTSGSYSRQYRSVLLVHTPEQRTEAEAFIAQQQAKYPSKKIHIAVEQATDFYQAEEYHLKFIEKQMSRKQESYF